MNKIDISGYKSIKKLSLNLQPVNILIGANGSGKSNFLSFFDFLKQAYNRNMREFVALKGIDAFLHKGNKVTDEISAKLYFPNANAYSFTIRKGDAGFIFTKEEMLHDAAHYKNPVEIASFGHESALRHQTVPPAKYIRNYLSQLATYHFHDTGENSPFNRESNIENDKYYLYEKGGNLGAYLYNIQKEKPIVYNFIVKTVQSIA
ncbi:MAG: AAA family ATPase, partial [Prevotellaceae bacterium]|nr:AAA family ATPase [Prevotellaceae bacterium]